MISVHGTATGCAAGDLARFRREFYQCLTRRADALFELCDAVLCAEGPVRSLAELSLVGDHLHHRRPPQSRHRTATVTGEPHPLAELLTSLTGIPLTSDVAGPTLEPLLCA